MNAKVIYLPEAHGFLAEIDGDARSKILYNVKKIRNGLLDATLFKKLKGTDIWEFRTLFEGKCYRLLAFWDTRSDTLVVATHGFVKKSDKTPKNEIYKAEQIRKDYFNNKI